MRVSFDCFRSAATLRPLQSPYYTGTYDSGSPQPPAQEPEEERVILTVVLIYVSPPPL